MHHIKHCNYAVHGRKILPAAVALNICISCYRMALPAPNGCHPPRLDKSSPLGCYEVGSLAQRAAILILCDPATALECIFRHLIPVAAAGLQG